MNEMKQVVIMRIFIVFFIVVSAVIAIFKDSHPEVTFIAQMMGVSWGALAGAFPCTILVWIILERRNKGGYGCLFCLGDVQLPCVATLLFHFAE